jgi:hypothetical protein
MAPGWPDALKNIHLAENLGDRVRTGRPAILAAGLRPDAGGGLNTPDSGSAKAACLHLIPRMA